MRSPFQGKNVGRNLLATLAMGAGVLGADGIRHYRVSPRPLCGIPPADYQPPQPPPAVRPMIAISQVGFVLAPPATPSLPAAPMSLQINGQPVSPIPRVKVFQFVPTGMQIDHCSISRMALTIQDNGFWRLSLQADQNPIVETATALTTVQPASGSPPALPTAPIRGLPKVSWKDTSFIKRNLFVIRIRGLGSFQEAIPVPPAPLSIGKPVLFALNPIEFWVQNGVPFPLVAQPRPFQAHPDVKRFFDMVDRVELEFSYR
jgi:hypothetical protein